MELEQALHELSRDLKGELYWDKLHQSIYATDASVYRKLPLAVCFPKDKDDLIRLLAFARLHKVPLTPRTAGTSLAGQCVGDGIIVDTSKHFTRILAFDELNRTITVEPGVIRDELNRFLKPFGLFFGPNTSTSNRCMMGGMVGNNSSGTTSIKYGVTRDKVLQIETVLSDGSQAVFGPVKAESYAQKMKGNSLESKIYQMVHQELSREEVREEIRKEFPKKRIHRRNGGYAVDALLDTRLFSESSEEINLSKLLCGSEGTLAFTTSIQLKLNDLPPANSLLVAAHFHSINESMRAVVVAMQHDLYMCELMDKTILDCTRNNREQAKNRFFVEGDPAAILLLEVCAAEQEEAESMAEKLIQDLQQQGFGYAYPKLHGQDMEKAFELRKAGLGLLGNIVGDRKAVACIEDTAVEVGDLPAYISEFTQMMKDYGQEAVYYAHAGAGELHLRPILNLKKESDVRLFREITGKVAQLVKKYGGSMSGEHGDGIVRSEFLKFMIGDRNYALMSRIKQAFDPMNLLNPGKIVDPWPMDRSLRYEPERQEPEISTLMDFSDSEGILRAAEKCNGSGDCRKPVAAGGTMCPSYRATLDEKDTTRARANALREFLTNGKGENRFANEELKRVFDLCLSCKACASECPSNVDVAALKAEFLYQYQKSTGTSMRSRLFADNVKWNTLGSIAPGLTNTVLNLGLVKRGLGIAAERSIPKLASTRFRKWLRAAAGKNSGASYPSGRVHLFVDEFTDFYDAEVGRDSYVLLNRLGYEVIISDHKESGRSFISKGLLDEAKELADQNVAHFRDLIDASTPLVGLEPSAILTFRDEYLRLAADRDGAAAIAKNTFTIEEFLEREIQRGRISADQFTDNPKAIKVHGHCHQKSLSNMRATQTMLNLPRNFRATILNTGCCGMAGSFGYEKEHYALSMKVGEDSLFPKVRNTGREVELVASGTSCRHQIMDGTGRRALHPVTVLRQALK